MTRYFLTYCFNAIPPVSDPYTLPFASMLGFYNHNYHILQTPGYFVIAVEMIHDARIIPLDGRPHVGQQLRHMNANSASSASTIYGARSTKSCFAHHTALPVVLGGACAAQVNAELACSPCPGPVAQTPGLRVCCGQLGSTSRADLIGQHRTLAHPVPPRRVPCGERLSAP